MHEVSTELSPEDIADIERHKYFLSEKAGHDVGWEFAEVDWRANHCDSSHRCDESHEACEFHQATEARGFSQLIRRLLSKSAR